MSPRPVRTLGADRSNDLGGTAPPTDPKREEIAGGAGSSEVPDAGVLSEGGALAPSLRRPTAPRRPPWDRGTEGTGTCNHPRIPVRISLDHRSCPAPPTPEPGHRC